MTRANQVEKMTLSLKDTKSEQDIANIVGQVGVYRTLSLGRMGCFKASQGVSASEGYE